MRTLKSYPTIQINQSDQALMISDIPISIVKVLCINKIPIAVLCVHLFCVA